MDEQKIRDMPERTAPLIMTRVCMYVCMYICMYVCMYHTPVHVINLSSCFNNLCSADMGSIPFCQFQFQSIKFFLFDMYFVLRHLSWIFANQTFWTALDSWVEFE